MAKQLHDEKWIQYAILIQDKIIELIINDGEALGVSKEELQDEENLKQFFHALSTVVPANLFNKWTGDNKNFLEFNHIANTLCFEYTVIEGKK